MGATPALAPGRDSDGLIGCCTRSCGKAKTSESNSEFRIRNDREDHELTTVGCLKSEFEL